TDRIINVTVHHDERKYGTSQYSFKRLVRDFKLEVMSNTVLPLKLVKYVGGISCLASLVLMIVYLIEYITGSIEVLGWTTIIVLMLLFFGITLMSIGIIGEYLMRIIGESKKIPNYFIRKN
ncbi:MAG: glycosyltransferase, partial [Lentihominibacter sp.]|nr:glycosyltransferase [Lentihominibacter sp.]